MLESNDIPQHHRFAPRGPLSSMLLSSAAIAAGAPAQPSRLPGHRCAAERRRRPHNRPRRREARPRRRRHRRRDRRSRPERGRPRPAHARPRAPRRPPAPGARRARSVPTGLTRRRLARARSARPVQRPVRRHGVSARSRGPATAPAARHAQARAAPRTGAGSASAASAGTRRRDDSRRPRAPSATTRAQSRPSSTSSSGSRPRPGRPGRPGADRARDVGAVGARPAAARSTTPIVDPDTEIANMAAFEQAARPRVERATRYQRPLGLLLLELEQDGPGGRLLGERDARDAVERSAQEVREADTVARLGPSRFAVICPEAPAGVDRDPRPCDRARLEERRLHCWVGFAERNETDERPADLVARAATALAQARPGARARTCRSRRRAPSGPFRGGGPRRPPPSAPAYGSAANRRGSFVITPVTPSESQLAGCAARGRRSRRRGRRPAPSPPRRAPGVTSRQWAITAWHSPADSAAAAWRGSVRRMTRSTTSAGTAMQPGLQCSRAARLRHRPADAHASVIVARSATRLSR